MIAIIIYMRDSRGSKTGQGGGEYKIKVYSIQLHQKVFLTTNQILDKKRMICYNI